MKRDPHTPRPERIARLHAVRDRFIGDATSTQCDRLLAALRELGHVTTFEGMRYLDLYDPRARKLQLVKAGHPVIMTWRTILTEAGEKHRVGLYHLQRG
jgi:hypothetical protein